MNPDRPGRKPKAISLPHWLLYPIALGIIAFEFVASGPLAGAVVSALWVIALWVERRLRGN